MFLKSFLVISSIVALALGEVIDLTDDDFSTRVGEVETTLVMFYAPW